MNGSFPGKKSGLVGCDVAGVVDQVVGPEVDDSSHDNIKVGDEVYADAVPTLGAFAEYCKVRAVTVVHKPKNISFEQAAVLPLWRG